MPTSIIIYLIITNLIAFILYGLDKYKAIKNAWRIPESLLLTISFLGGSIGAILGMIIFRHKTKKKSFRIMIPLIIIIQILVLL